MYCGMVTLIAQTVPRISTMLASPETASTLIRNTNTTALPGSTTSNSEGPSVSRGTVVKRKEKHDTVLATRFTWYNFSEDAWDSK